MCCQSINTQKGRNPDLWRIAALCLKSMHEIKPFAASLRWYYPDQVHRVAARPLRLPLSHWLP